MTKVPFLPYHPLLTCSRAFQKCAALPRMMGKLVQSEGMRHVIGYSDIGDQCLEIHLLVDEEDGVVADAKFSSFTHPAATALAELVCKDALRKTYDQLRRINADYITNLVENTETTLPADFYSYVNLVVDALLAAAVQCLDIPLDTSVPQSPVEFDQLEAGELPEYESMTHEERLALIRYVLDKDVRPYIELDAGGIEVVELKNEIELIIAYQGACTTCPSSIGGTLDAITRILRAKVHPHLQVSPDESFLAQFMES